MPKYYTFPTLFDEVKQISISKLKEWEYLNPKQIKSSVLTWSSNGEETGSISIRVSTLTEQPYIALDYKYGGEPRNYKVRLVSVPSNIGKGKVWYFLCPHTNKRCRKLYSIGGYFLHREAFKGAMYESQTKSKFYRQLEKCFGSRFQLEKLYEQLHKKHFKKTYAGKPTKKYLQLMQKIEKYERASLTEFPYEVGQEDNIYQYLG
ncbi:MAG: hypothetical protein AAF734_01355 [Bacteroidota bacterium]